MTSPPALGLGAKSDKSLILYHEIGKTAIMTMWNTSLPSGDEWVWDTENRAEESETKRPRLPTSGNIKWPNSCIISAEAEEALPVWVHCNNPLKNPIAAILSPHFSEVEKWRISGNWVLESIVCSWRMDVWLCLVSGKLSIVQIAKLCYFLS